LYTLLGLIIALVLVCGLIEGSAFAWAIVAITGLTTGWFFLSLVVSPGIAALIILSIFVGMPILSATLVSSKLRPVHVPVTQPKVSLVDKYDAAGNLKAEYRTVIVPDFIPEDWTQ